MPGAANWLEMAQTMACCKSQCFLCHRASRAPEGHAGREESANEWLDVNGMASWSGFSYGCSR